ncbi:VWA domain-containing protein [Candidatus Venteria ishoeyi]|uniref:nitric oxide reductase activation protein NorD n=1 Tax=Candidatus Venteria ishoeyi TaxID=1899563 RepID=UPI0025A51EF9|nr:VWA domain-containing protein [Candidatus Venteria ishoeyi]MDM8545629.1 VWA domain-containing protein [Candidatus Venteria ishoeyi]
MTPEEIQVYRDQLQCSFAQLENIFEDCINDALRQLSPQGVKDYLKGASLICMIGRGFEPVLVYLEEMPTVAHQVGEDALTLVSQTVWDMSRSPNGKAIPLFLDSIAEAARRLGSEDSFKHYIELIVEMMNDTSRSIHNNQNATIPSPGLPELLKQIPYLLSQLSLEGLKNWMAYGVRNYYMRPDYQASYFCLQSADSKAMLQRERHGTLFMDNERKLDAYLKALWDETEQFVPYSLGFDELRKPRPYYDNVGIRLPDVYDDKNNVPGIDRYRATIAHMAAHRRWTSPIIADNFSPFQRVGVELLEDSRVEYLAMQQYPGLRNILKALHPAPIEGDCEPQKESCILHRLAMLSRAILDADHGYQNPVIKEFVERFYAAMQQGESSPKEMASIAISFIAKTRLQSDQSPNIRFENTEVDYRDDNRHMWIFIEENDEAEDYDATRETKEQDIEVDGLPPRHYKEWDYRSSSYRPDWVSLYESLHPSGSAADIDKLLEKNSALAKRLKQILDTLKPQQYVRVRYQEEGSELDLDVAIRSLIDYKAGSQPDPRINMSHKHDGRDIAVMLLLDLSQSLNDIPDGCQQTILELSQEAVSLLAWAIEHLGDKFAIAGFSSNTRHEVRYQHIKGFTERWDDAVKARLAAIQAGYSTRMGAAMRHAAHYLEKQKADKKLLLVLTDGEPADIDTDDEQILIQDTHKAVQELDQDGIFTYCINLDPRADDYVKDIFGGQYSVIDHVDRLPEKLPKLFMSLTK